MANNDYDGSLAQQYVNFSITETINTALGTNFQTPMIFIDDLEAASNFMTPPAIGTATVVNYSNYTDIVDGTLLQWLSYFFQVNSISQVYIIVYDHATGGNDFSGLTTQFNNWHTYGYFKLLYSSAPSGLVTLAQLCDNDSMLSQCWIGTNDANCLNTGSLTSIYHYLHAANVNPHLEFYYDDDVNSAWAQLGLSLATLNGTGFSVGNSLDYKATNVIGASGPSGLNLNATDVQALKTQNIGYWATVGNNSGQVAQYGGKTIKGDLCGAEWFVAFIEYMCSALGAAYLTDPAQNHFRNNDTYQGLLTILRNQVTPFETIGRISNFKITAPNFADLADTGDSIIVPNAWSAVYNDTVRSATIQGNLIVTV